MGEDDPEQAAYFELCAYTLGHGDPRFIHQHVVDAFAAQRADRHSKAIGVAFALMGLCLYLERGHTGREVQRAHMRLARRRKEWPRFEPPGERGEVRASDVLAANPGPERDAAIEAWSARCGQRGATSTPRWPSCCGRRASRRGQSRRARRRGGRPRRGGEVQRPRRLQSRGDEPLRRRA